MQIIRKHFNNLLSAPEPRQRSVIYLILYGALLILAELILPQKESYVVFTIFGITIPGFGSIWVIKNRNYKHKISLFFLFTFSVSSIFWILNAAVELDIISISKHRFLIYSFTHGILCSCVSYLYTIELEKIVNHRGCAFDIMFVTLIIASPFIWLQVENLINETSYSQTELILISISSISNLYLILSSSLLVFLYPNSIRFWFLLTLCGIGMSLHSLILNIDYFETGSYSYVERSDIFWILDLSALFAIAFISGNYHKKTFDSLKVNIKIQYRLAWIASVTPSLIPLQFVLFDHLNLMQVSTAFLLGTILLSIVLVGVRISGLVSMSARYHGQLTHLATTDSLTGTLNRRGIMKVIANDLKPSDFIIVSDINEFKSINDYHGHPAGDEVLKKLVIKLEKLQQRGLIHAFGRTGGDEFVALLKVDAQNIESSVKSITNMLSGWMVIGDFKVLYSVCVGAAQVRSYGIDETIKIADQALYVAKRSETEKFMIYRESQYRSRQEIRELIQLSLDKKRIESMVQPIFEPSELRCVGAEVLMRLSGTDGESISTHQFIPLARQHGLIDNMMHYMLIARSESISNLPEDFFIAINIAPSTLPSEERFNSLIQTLKRLPIKPCNVVLELTEDRFIEIDALIEPVKRLSSMGYKVALDDFGIGDSSLARAAALPIDIIKIDRQLIDGLNNRKKHVLTSTMNLSKKLSTIRIVEGVESEAQHHQAMDIGADLLQGFYYSKPVSWDTLIEQFINLSTPAKA